MARQPIEATPSDNFTAKWIAEIEGSEKWQRTFLERCRRIIKRYRDERLTKDNQPGQDKKRYPILWSNIQTLGPAVYAKPPEAVVTRRYKDSDPIGRYASEVLERAINFSCSQYDFDERMELSRDDLLLIGRGQCWVRYIPHVSGPEESDEDAQVTTDAEDEGSEEEKQVYAEVVTDHVAFDDFGYTPCREWSEVWYGWRRAYMGRDELVERFGKKVGGKVPLDWEPKDQFQDEEAKIRNKKAAIYEVWDKRAGEVLWFSKSYKVGPLDRRSDWLGLDGFFPFPRPLMATTPQDKFIPVADFVYYQDQAEELDELTARIGFMINAIKVAGFYAGEENIKLQNLFNSESNQLVPIDSMASFTDKGGFKGLIEWFPLDNTIKALQTAFETRKEILEDIYQITGIADIIRGASDPNETATAQTIKSQWGSIRVRDKQNELARFARDLMRIKGEIIAKKFDPQTLAAMTDVQLPTDAQKKAGQAMQAYQQQQVQQMQAQAQQQAQPPQPGMPPQPAAPPPQVPPPPPMPPDMPPPEILALPSWEDVNGLLKNDALRSFRVDIETDSTIQADEDADKQRRVEFVTAIGALLAQALPVLQAAPQIAPLIGKTVEFLARGFHVGREMEDIINKTFDQLAQQPPQAPGQAPKPGTDPQEVALKAQELQLKQQEAQFQAQHDAAQLQLDAAKVQAEQARTQSDAQLGMGDLQLRAQQQVLDHQQNQQQNNIAMLRPPPRGPTK